MSLLKSLRILLILPVLFIVAQPLTAEYVAPADRNLPIVYDVDVLVLGGSTGAVAAAQESAKAGVKTMLVTQYPYLGEDLAATLRLWQERDNTVDDPLAKAIYDDGVLNTPAAATLDTLLRHPKKLNFTYKIEQEVSAKHSDTKEKNRLTDGKAESPRTDSVQVDGDATIVLDLGGQQEIGLLSVIPFYRKGHFATKSVEFFSSDDGKEWTSLGEGKRDTKGLVVSDSPDPFTLQLQRQLPMSFVKICTKIEESSRITLLGEIILLADRRDLAAAPPVKTTSNPSAPARPLHIKKVLDDALLESGVSFLYGMFVSGLIKDAQGNVRGAVVNSRAGRQAILAKTVIDARPDYAQLLESHEGSDTVSVEFVVVGGVPVPFEKDKYSLLQNGTCETMGEPFRAHWPNQAQTQSGEFPILRYRFDVKKDDADKAFGGDLESFGKLETQIRMAAYHADKQFTSDRITLLLGSKKPETVALGNLCGGEGIVSGRKIGQDVAKKALAEKDIVLDPKSLRVELAGKPAEGSAVAGEIRELLEGIRSYEKPLGTVCETGTKYPVAATYDVVVVGGGTTGAPAGIAAARNGAKTLVVEYLHDLGGVGTLGAIAGYYWGNKVGFTEEISVGKRSWNTEHKAQLWRTKLHEAGGDAWYGVLGAGAVVEVDADKNNSNPVKVKGIIITTDFGPQLVLAKVVIDTTGNGDIAMCAGAKMSFVTDREITVQGAGLAPRNLGGRYMNNDYSYIDDTDPIDATHVFVYSKGKFPTAFDQGKILNTRERRRIVGDFSFTPLDQLNKRTYPDSIARAYSNFDTHGYTTEPYLEIYHPKKIGYYAYYPYRSSLPKGLDGILVGALATSCHRDAIPVIRMQSDLQNQGYGLGWAAATAIRDGVPIRQVDIRKVQKHLVEIGNLPESVLTETDNYETLKCGLANAVKELPTDLEQAALVMWYPNDALPLLRKSYAETDDQDAKFAYAKVLAGLGDATGEAALIQKLRDTEEWDTGWNFKAMSQFGFASSPLDQTIMMLGRIHSRAAVPLIVEKLSKLKKEDDFSHHRACALALEWIGDSHAAPAIAEHLKKEGVMGYAHDSIETARKRDAEDPKVALGEKSRRDSLIEIGMARALYSLGDVDGLGEKILKAYSKDMRGHFARHAGDVLNKPTK